MKKTFATTSVKLISACESHSHAIWEWRNDDLTRQMSRSPEVVSWNNHDTWFKNSLVNPNRFIYVGIVQCVPAIFVGMIRFDLSEESDGIYEVSINVAPEHRGFGVGGKLLDLGINKLLSEVAVCNGVLAEVRVINESSNALFLRRGFQKIRSDDHFSHYALIINEDMSGRHEVQS